MYRASATDTKKQLIGSLQQNGDAARLELVWQLVEMNDVDWDARGEAAVVVGGKNGDEKRGRGPRTADRFAVEGAWVVLNRDIRAGGSAMKVNRNEARTESINIRVRPSSKRMAVAVAKAEERSLSIFISKADRGRSKAHRNMTEKR